MSSGARLRIVPVDPDPGPVPQERPEKRKSFPSNRTLELEQRLQASWRELVAQVRATADRDASIALGQFRLDLEAFLDR